MSHNIKKQSQLERIILFTDAVFAIAITLLAIEIKIPELHERHEQEAINGIIALLPRLIGFVISFFVIGIYWIAHHKIFSFVVNFNRKLLWMNLFLLMFIVLMPFTTGFFFEYSVLKFPFLLYSLNILTIGVLQARMLNYISRSKLTEGINGQLRKYISYRGLIPGMLFLTVAIVQYFVPDRFVGPTRILMMFTMVPFYFLRKHFARKGVDVINY